MPIDALNILCAHLMRDLFAIAKFLLTMFKNCMACLKQYNFVIFFNIKTKNSTVLIIIIIIR